MDTGELSGKPNEMLGVVALLLVALCDRNGISPSLMGPLARVQTSPWIFLTLLHSFPSSITFTHLVIFFTRGRKLFKAFQHLQTGFHPQKK